jgi:hypothetical protein
MRLPCPAMDSTARDVDCIHSGFEIRGIDCQDTLIEPEGFATRERFRPRASRPSSPWRATPTGYRLPPIEKALGRVDNLAHFLTALDVLAWTFLQHHRLRVR